MDCSAPLRSLTPSAMDDVWRELGSPSGEYFTDEHNAVKNALP
ncbi:hypothetical protein [Oceanispirochaeta sp.]|nr:hypothetical protein [Oceanispirochaeta sp.]MDA3955715.1 hypothetical protein [Oceanispirochaeta sp.]